MDYIHQNKTSLNADNLAYLWYPLVLITALSIHNYMIEAGVSILYSTYIPVLFSAISITILEIYFPYRKEWFPEKNDVINDGIFMVTVQVILPQFLAFLMALILVKETPLTLWPHQLPVVIQVIIMILLADFLRYWLHVASHNWMPLWQLHAVHHSPKKLYWFNVGRFHPFEKFLQFLFDTLPFIILGVDENVLAMYFVFYASNGYFQHSNVYLKMGFLNYVISSAELHRWHHSLKVHEANRNYGNNIIIWDLLFGTYFFPQNKSVGELGLKNRNYPASFLQLMISPFIIRLESINLPFVSIREIFVNLLLRIRFEYLYLVKRTYLINGSRNPRKYQTRLLEKIIKNNQASLYGKDHNFNNIKNYSDYQNNCPISTYNDLSNYINLEDNIQHGLTTELPVFYQVTSGTSGKSKFLPITKSGLKKIKNSQKLLALARYLDNPGTFTGKIFGVVSPAIEGVTNSGIPYGSASGLIYQNMPALSRLKYVVPYEVFNLKEYDLKYFLIALYALSEPRVTIIATANPSTMIRILEVINSNTTQLLEILGNGEIKIPYKTTEQLTETINSGLTANPDRTENLRKIFNNNGRLTYKDIWPNLQTLVTWTGGSCGFSLTALKKDLPEDIKISEMGYLASEMQGTISIRYQQGIPTFTANFFEFISVDDWNTGRKHVKLLDQLEQGERYYVIVTTVNGLYRYFMNDIVEVTGFINKTPTLKFIQKGAGVTNITGEKLYENQALEAVRILQEKFDINVVFNQWLADEEQSQYQVLIELSGNNLPASNQLQEALENVLFELNIEYKQKRDSGRLKPLKLILLKPGTGDYFKLSKIEQGQREGQFKTLILIYKNDNKFPFTKYAIN